jgi:hypothetical protein
MSLQELGVRRFQQRPGYSAGPEMLRRPSSLTGFWIVTSAIWIRPPGYVDAH